ncbi:cytidylate kinase [Kribbella aluminosa]|uniref:Cytidylate kinase n=1 Tax=Kribbella aluminosa TaxID=416017 RepID=A0ABS4V0R4_9ACTN|nr:hypothetical protein [Kribbella aluminosa]MBP2357493.1 cytidylate kinase [Kribbella aluminosa]
MPKVVLVTGMQAAGKSTIAPLLAARMGPPAATLDGDVFYRGVVVLAPSVESIVRRELGRGGGNSYRDWQTPDGSLETAVRALQAGLDEIPRRGLWLDTSGQAPSETVDTILTKLPGACW